MPRHCSAGGCKSRDNRETRNAGITFHKLPKGATRRNLWINNSHRADFWDPQTDFVYFCSKHFTPESFELTGCSGIRRLKEDALPTVFESPSTSKTKRAGTKRKQEDVFVRKSSCSGARESPQQEMEEPTIQKPVAEVEESHENLPVSSHEPSGVKQLPPEELSPPPPTESSPSSPSRYMRRLPPPPGFYLSKDHSYAQLCPLLWRRRYDKAIDCLEKTLRQLHAARRRENRLRKTVIRLRDKRLKHTRLASGDRGSWNLWGHKGEGSEGFNQEDNRTDVKFEDTGLFECTCMEHMEPGDHFLSHSKTWFEEERGYCFSCGRGQVRLDGQAELTLSKSGKSVQPKHHEDSLNSVKASTCVTVNSISDTQMVRLEKNVDATDSDKAQEPTPLLSNVCEGESEAVGNEHQPDLQQQFWIHGTAEGHVILVPVPAEDGLQSFVKLEDDSVKVQTILVSEVYLKGEREHMQENSGDQTRAEAASNEEHSDIISTSAGRREDVREKLKEHLEGFHLQLSNEFLN